MSLADPPPIRDRRDSDGRSRKANPSSPSAAKTTLRRQGAFGRSALKLFDLGLLPIPCNPRNIKAPGVSHATWQRDPGRDIIARWVAAPRHRGAEVGILTGRGRLPVTVVDVDDVSQVEALVALLGPTPLIIGTPSGGRHLYYRFSGERCANLRSSGWSVDVKAQGGFVVVPPTRKQAAGANGKTGRYSIIKGSWKQLDRLPALPPDWRTRLDAARTGTPSQVAARPAAPTQLQGTIRNGRRNNAAFSAGLRLAHLAENGDQMRDVLHDWYAANCEGPVDVRELDWTAASVWKYHTEGRNWTGTGGVNVTQDVVRDIGDPDALLTWLHLLFAHGARQAPFALVIPRMVEEGSIPGLGAHRLRKAIARLLSKGYLQRVYSGGRCKGDPSLYRLATPGGRAAV